MDQADDVTDEVQGGVFLNRGGPVAAGVTALVRGDDVVSGPGQGRELVAPVVPAFGKAVEQEDQGPFAVLRGVQLMPSNGNGAVLDHGHAPPSRVRFGT